MASTAKVLLGVGCVTLLAVVGALVTCTAWLAHVGSKSNSSSSANAASTQPGIPAAEASVPAEDASFMRMRSKEGVDFIVADQALRNDSARLAGRAKSLCNTHKDELACEVFIWPKSSLVPKTLRMADKQARAIAAYYVRSSDKQHECFRAIQDGHEGSAYGECGKTSVEIDEAVNAWHGCKQSVLGQLRAPSSAEFVDDRADRHVFLEEKKENPVQRAVALVGDWEFGFTNFIVQGEVDAQNAFGARLRSSFECSVTRTKADRWMVMKARILSTTAR